MNQPPPSTDRNLVRDAAITFGSCAAAVLIFACFVVACPNKPPVSPVDASDSQPTTCTPTLAQAACDSMASAGCAEGRVPDCATVMCVIASDPSFTHYNLQCIANAADGGASAIRACGIDCLP